MKEEIEEFIAHKYNQLKIALKNWYKGKHVPGSIKPSNQGIVLSLPHYKKPFLARAINFLVRVIKKFWLAHWGLIVASVIAMLIGTFILSLLGF